MHLAARDGASLIERHLGHAGILVEETVHHLVLRSASSSASKRVQGAIWAPVDKLVSLQTLVILDMLGKLAERVARG